MATRSNIAIVNQDKSISSIYCHWDGYPENNGKILLNHYNNAGIVHELLDLGNLSQLCEKLYSDNNSHTFANPESGVCVAYGRERGEKDQEAIVFDDLREFEDNARNSWTDYQYLFDNGVWRYRNVNNTLGWRELTPEVCKIK
jgi:hypothetical protein